MNHYTAPTPSTTIKHYLPSIHYHSAKANPDRNKTSQDIRFVENNSNIINIANDTFDNHSATLIAFAIVQSTRVALHSEGLYFLSGLSLCKAPF
jgi:hypothetical protein